MAGVVITSNAVIGDHVCVLPNTVIHHDAASATWSLIGSNVTIAGDTSIGENCYIGSGTSIMNGLTIGAGALVGLGSTVIRSAAAGAVLPATRRGPSETRTRAATQHGVGCRLDRAPSGTCRERPYPVGGQRIARDVLHARIGGPALDRRCVGGATRPASAFGFSVTSLFVAL